MLKGKTKYDEMMKQIMKLKQLAQIWNLTWLINNESTLISFLYVSLDDNKLCKKIL